MVVLALQRALAREGSIPAGTGLSKHIVAVTHTEGTPIRWDEIGRGLDLLRRGQEVAYVGLTGSLDFDNTAQSRGASTNWWTIGPAGFVDIPSASDCR